MRKAASSKLGLNWVCLGLNWARNCTVRRPRGRFDTVRRSRIGFVLAGGENKSVFVMSC